MSKTSPAPALPVPPPLLAADLPDKWVAGVATAIAREGQAVRPGADAPVIEVQSINTGEFMPLQLSNNGVAFTSAAERDAALARLLPAPRLRRMCPECRGRGYFMGPSGSHSCDCASGYLPDTTPGDDAIVS